MASQQDPRRYEAEDEDFLDREENYVKQKSANMNVSRVTATNRRKASHQNGGTKNGSSRKTQPPVGAPRKASTVGIVAQAVQRMESHGTLVPPPPPPPPHSHLSSISEGSDDDSLAMNDIFPQAFEKDGSVRAGPNVSKSGTRGGSIYIPVFQEPWNEKSVMYLHASTIGATNVGTQYMKDLEFDDDDHSLDVVDIFPALLNKTSLKSRRIEPPPPAPKSIVAAVQAAAKRAEAAIATEKAQKAVSPQPSDSKGRDYPLPLHPSPVPQGLDELPMDSALKRPIEPTDIATRAPLERKKSKKLKKESSRKKSRKHTNEDIGSVESEEARRERRRRKKEKRAKKKARETGEEKSRKKKKKHKRHSSDSHLNFDADDNAPVSRNSMRSLPDLSDKEDIGLEQQMERVATRAGLDDYIRDREAFGRRSRISLHSGQTTLKASNITQSATSPQSDGHTTVRQSNVAKKESRAPSKSKEELTVDRSSFLKNNSSGMRKENEPLSDSARHRKSRGERKDTEAGLSSSARSNRVERKATDAGLSDSARSRKAELKVSDDKLLDSARFHKTRAEGRKAAEDAMLASGQHNAMIRPLSPRKETLTVSTTASHSAPLPIKSRPPIRSPETRKRLKDPSQAPLETYEKMDSVGRFDMLTAVDSAVQSKKAEKRTSATKPSVPSIADTKKKKSHNIFMRLFSRKAESDGEGAEQSRPRPGLFGGSNQSKGKKQHTRSVPIHRGAQDVLVNEYLNTTAKTDSKTSWNDSIEEETRLLNSPSRPTVDLTDMKYALGTPPGDRLGTSPLLYSPSRPTMDSTDMKYLLGRPPGGRPGTPGDRPGTSPLRQVESSNRRRKSKIYGPGSS